MIGVALALLLLGLALSALYSGSETGLYRVTRVRLVIDAVEGDWISWALLQLTNYPAVFVATTLIGNNAANYTISLAVVLLTREIVQADAAELAASVLITPLVFVYGELLPKYLFYNVPYLLLRRTAPLFLFSVVLFAPVSALLGLLAFGLQSVLGETPLRVRPALARKELQQVLQEGQEAGILRPPQRRVAQNLFDLGGQPLIRFCRSPARILSAPQGADKLRVLGLAQQRGEAIIAITEPGSQRWIGYLRLVDLYLSAATVVERGHPLIQLHQNESLVHGLVQLQSTKAELAQVVDDAGRPVGLLYAHDLIDLMVRSGTERVAAGTGRQGVGRSVAR